MEHPRSGLETRLLRIDSVEDPWAEQAILDALELSMRVDDDEAGRNERVHQPVTIHSAYYIESDDPDEGFGSIPEPAAPTMITESKGWSSSVERGLSLVATVPEPVILYDRRVATPQADLVKTFEVPVFVVGDVTPLNAPEDDFDDQTEYDETGESEHWEPEVVRTPVDRRTVLAVLGAGGLAAAAASLATIEAQHSDTQPGGRVSEPGSAFVSKAPVPKKKPTDNATPPSPEQQGDAKRRRQEIIASIDSISASQKKTLSLFVEAIVGIKDELHDINLSVMAAQAVLESGWMKSDLARIYHNYFGMKATASWKGKRTPPLPTYEYSNGKRILIDDVFRAYDSMEEGFGAYAKNIRGKDWYDDARANAGSVEGYLDGLVKEPKNPNLIYATDPNYKTKVMKLIEQLRLEEIFAEPSEKDEVLPSTEREPIVLRPERYSSIQKPLNGNGSSAAIVELDNGEKILSKKLSYKERVKIIETRLNATRNTREGFKEWKAQKYHDLRSEVRRKYSNFDGSRNGSKSKWPNGLGRPKSPEDIKFFVVHFTATGTKNGFSKEGGASVASSMQNSGSLAVQYSINYYGETNWLTSDWAMHTLPWDKRSGNPDHYYHRTAYGVEMTACEQADINKTQYESLIYLLSNHLIETGKIKKGESVTKVVRKHIIGHREANPASGTHNDFPGIVMDGVRILLVDFLVRELGYDA